MRFYLGTHEVSWLGRTDIPLFISRRRLALRKSFPKAKGPWALDSGGFSELSMYGRWETTPEQYTEEVRRYAREIGNMEWAAIQDWMCEPEILKKTGLTVEEHQRRTVANYLRLRELAPEIPWTPVIQGWTLEQYLACVELYKEAGVDLRELPIVGIGTICRRQNTLRAGMIIGWIAGMGIRLHGFGLKVQGLRNCAQHLVSSDSLAWSFQARRERRTFNVTDERVSLQNSVDFAMDWREEMLASLPA